MLYSKYISQLTLQLLFTAFSMLELLSSVVYVVSVLSVLVHKHALVWEILVLVRIKNKTEENRAA